MSTIRRAIVKDEGVEKLIAQLADFPTRIKDARNATTDAEFEAKMFNGVKVVKEELTLIEGEIAADVQFETGDNGKPKFTNKELRDAEINKRCPLDPRWVAATEQLKEAEQAQLKLDWEFARTRNSVGALYEEWKGLIAIAEIVSGLSHENREASLVEKINDYHTRFTQIADLTPTVEETSNVQ